MRNTKLLWGMLAVALAFGLTLAGCKTETDSGNSANGSFYAGKIGNSSPAHSLISRAVVDGVDFGDFPLDEFSIAVVYVIGRSTTSDYMGWGILNGNPAHYGAVIPITSIIEIGDLSSLSPRDGHDFCDVVGFDLILLKNGQPFANFPETLFIKGEQFDFYKNPQSGYMLPSFWKDGQDIFDRYPLTPNISSQLFDDFIVIPFAGIDLNREFDLKFEWDISILVNALKDAKDNAGDYAAVEDKTQPYIKDFFESFALRVIYKN